MRPIKWRVECYMLDAATIIGHADGYARALARHVRRMLLSDTLPLVDAAALIRVDIER